MTPDNAPKAADRHLLARHREAHTAALVDETEDLLAAGAKPSEVLWLLSPTSFGATLARDTIREVSASAPDLAARLETLQAGLPPDHLSCVYIGPEGMVSEAVPVEVDDG